MEIEILKAQVAALKELIAIKDQTIAELKLKPSHSTVTYVYEYRYSQYQNGWYPYQYGAQGGAGGISVQAQQAQLNHQQGQMYCGQGANQGTGGTLRGHISGSMGQAGGSGQSNCEAYGGTSNVLTMTGSK